ncbi:MAG: hypothetical protein JRN15_06785 [Nitrososphaerota archaeon]|nr:hypothetical protein [Nitrososphaerota archaeon]
MVVTTVDIPDELLEFVDSITSTKKAHNRREVLINALSFYKRYDGLNWRDSKISIGGFRKAMLGQKLVELLQNYLTHEQLYDVGRRYGPTLHDYLLVNFGKESSDRSNYEFALQHLSDMGWGSLKIQDGRIVASDSFLPEPLLRGYLEAALGADLKSIPTVENIVLFEIKRSATAEVRRLR